MSCRPDVEFCGYSVPHPLEDKILFRVQTHRQKDALQVILKGLDELEKVRKLTDLERSASTFLLQWKEWKDERVFKNKVFTSKLWVKFTHSWKESACKF